MHVNCNLLKLKSILIKIYHRSSVVIEKDAKESRTGSKSLVQSP